MDKEGKLRVATQSLLDEIEGILRKAADNYPYLDGPARALKRMAKPAGRPLRIGILGEANSGKSSLANFLAGVPALPVPSPSYARVPVLLKYASKPCAAVYYNSGERVALPVLQDVAQTIAAIQNSAAMSGLMAGRSLRSGGLKLLEAGLPSALLRSIEILDFPAGNPGLQSYGVDAVIWTTAATQAWRESERAQWSRLPLSIQSRSFLAVTFCDLVADREKNLTWLRTRLETSTNSLFRGIHFVENGAPELAAAASGNEALLAQIQYLAYEFAAERFSKAMAVAHRVTAEAAAKARPATKYKHNGFSNHVAAETGEGMFYGKQPIILKWPVPEAGLEKQPIRCNGHAAGAAATAVAHRTAQASHSTSAGERSKGRPRWMPAAMAAAIAGTAALTIQLGLIGAGNNLASNPPPGASGTVEQAAIAKAETRRNANAEAAATGVRRTAVAESAGAEEGGAAQAEAVAAGARGNAVAEAAAAEERGQAQAEAVTEPRRRRKADARRRRWAEPGQGERHGRALVEAVLRRFGANGPIMHGVSQ